MQARCVCSCAARLLISFTSLAASDLCLSTCMVNQKLTLALLLALPQSYQHCMHQPEAQRRLLISFTSPAASDLCLSPCTTDE